MSEIVAVVDSLIRVPGRLPADVVEALRVRLRVRNPAHVSALRRGVPTRYIAEWIDVVETHNGATTIPRGCALALDEEAGRRGYRVRYQRVMQAAISDALALCPRPSLRGYQRDAVGALLAGGCGYATLPTGAGKTRVGVALAAARGATTLVVVASLDLLEQWVATFRDLLGIEAGVSGGGKHSPGEVVVATVQTIARLDERTRAAWLGQFGLLIVDECHHVPASTFRDVVARCPARYRVGLSATPKRDDGLTPLLEYHLGRELYAVGHAELREVGAIVGFDVEIVPTGCEVPWTGEEFVRMAPAKIIGDCERLGLVADRVRCDVEAGETVLVLSSRVEHCQDIAEHLSVQGVDSVVVTGAITGKKRTAILDRVRAGEVRVLIATQLADEGLDIPRLSRLHLAYPAKSAGRTVQRVGRVLRPLEGKGRPVVVDYVDRGPVVEAWARGRRRAYERILGRRI